MNEKQYYTRGCTALLFPDSAMRDLRCLPENKLKSMPMVVNEYDRMKVKVKYEYH